MKDVFDFIEQHMACATSPTTRRICRPSVPDPGNAMGLVDDASPTVHGNVTHQEEG